jgi:hypothetical protein
MSTRLNRVIKVETKEGFAVLALSKGQDSLLFLLNLLSKFLSHILKAVFGAIPFDKLEDFASQTRLTPGDLDLRLSNTRLS